MATHKEFVEDLMAHLGRGFSARAMFGEYAVYCEDRVVALVCDNTLFVKPMDASAHLERTCEQGPPYPGAKDHYIVNEGSFDHALARTLRAIARALPPAKKRPRASPKKRPPRAKKGAKPRTSK